MKYSIFYKGKDFGVSSLRKAKKIAQSLYKEKDCYYDRPRIYLTARPNTWMTRTSHNSWGYEHCPQEWRN